MLRASLAILAASAFVLAPLPALAGTGNCTEQTFGAACDSGDGNPCSGLCFLDTTQPALPMACIAVTADLLTRLGLTSLDGLGCSPSGGAGSDCAHACQASACTATDAAAGAACISSGGNVCTGACDGHGTCAAIDHGGEKYGRGELSACLYTACSARMNVPGGMQFPMPAGLACDDSNACTSGDTCTANGACVGTPVAGCTLPDQDGGLGTSHGVDGGQGATTPVSSGGGCAVGGPGGAVSILGAAAVVALLGAARRRR